MNTTSTHEDTGSIPGLSQWVKNLPSPRAMVKVTDVAQTLHCCGWCRPAAAAPILPLAWELPYVMNVALKSPPRPPKKNWYSHTVEYYTAMKMIKLQPNAANQINLMNKKSKVEDTQYHSS